MEQPVPRIELPGSLPAIRMITKAIPGSKSQFSSFLSHAKEVHLWCFRNDLAKCFHLLDPARANTGHIVAIETQEGRDESSELMA